MSESDSGEIEAYESEEFVSGSGSDDDGIVYYSEEYQSGEDYYEDLTEEESLSEEEEEEESLSEEEEIEVKPKKKKIRIPRSIKVEKSVRDKRVEKLRDIYSFILDIDSLSATDTEKVVEIVQDSSLVDKSFIFSALGNYTANVLDNLPSADPVDVSNSYSARYNEFYYGCRYNSLPFSENNLDKNVIRLRYTQSIK